MTFDGISNYGTTASQNIDMLSSTIHTALAVMASNAANISSGALCPLPEEVEGTGPTITVPWTYPLTLP